MNLKYTLTEVALVLLFMLITVAVTIPNLQEDRVSAEDADDATALKSGMLPAEVQFQAGAYATPGNDGLGAYATATALGPGIAYPMLSGAITTPDGLTLNLLAPTYQSAIPHISGYRFNDPVSTPTDRERVWAVSTQPLDETHGHRWFIINQEGNISASKPTVLAYVGTIHPTDPSLFGPNLTSAPSATRAVSYRR
jgi:hypothetical protein